MTCRPRLPSKYLSLELLVQKYCMITSLHLFWCPYMVINVIRVQQCNGGLLPDIILLTLCDSIGVFVPTATVPT